MGKLATIDQGTRGARSGKPGLLAAGTLFAASLLASAPALAAPAGSNKSAGATGGQLYHDYCSVCHGDKGDGNSRARNSFVRPPRDFTAPEAKNLNREFMIAIVRDGKPGTAMVGWKTQLNDTQIASVVDYIGEAFIKAGVHATDLVGAAKPAAPATAPAVNPHALPGAMPAMPPGMPQAPAKPANMADPMPGGLKGDFAKGRDFFMKNCATCHGTLGDGQGPRAYFINPKPRNFLEPNARAGFNRPFLYEAIAKGRLGTEMPAWDKVLSNQEIANVAEFVFQAYIQQKPEGAPQAKSR